MLAPLKTIAAGLALMQLCAGAASRQDAALLEGFREERPEADAPTEVALSVYLIDVVSIADAAETFEADLFFSLQWVDPRLADPALGLVGEQVALDSVWHPQLIITNRRSIQTFLPEVVQIGPGGVVLYRQRASGTFSCDLDLRDFPMDEQVLSISLVSMRYGPEEVTLLPNPERSGSRERISPAGWELEFGALTASTEYIEVQDRHLSRIEQHIEARRQPSHYRFKIFLPLTLIVLMAWAVFWIDPRELGPQIGISTSAVFTLIAFGLGLTSQLPTVAYLTRADQYVLGCTLLVFAALGEAVLTGYLARRERAELALRIDRLARVTYLVALALIGFATVWR